MFCNVLVLYFFALYWVVCLRLIWVAELCLLTLGSSSMNSYNRSWSYTQLFMHNVSLKWAPSFNCVLCGRMFFRLTSKNFICYLLFFAFWDTEKEQMIKPKKQLTKEKPSKLVSSFLDICGLINLYCVKNYLSFC